MYKDIETETSYKYLKTVISELKEPVCILGGWAVFFTVNQNYQKQSKRIYLGSRDIDIGFNTAESFMQAAAILENELNFEFVSFRYYKNIHAETGKDITENESKSLPQHMIFPMYVDPIMSYVNKEVKTKLGFTPVDEPLLKPVFENNECSKKVKEFGRNLLMPTAAILLATKINSVVLRDKVDKRHKDICDITALCLFSGLPIDEIIAKSKSFLIKNRYMKFKGIDFKDDIINSSNKLGLEVNIVKSVIGKIRER